MIIPNMEKLKMFQTTNQYRMPLETRNTYTTGSNIKATQFGWPF